MHRLGFLDGLRGIAALYVVMFHMALVPAFKPPVSDWWQSVVLFGGSGVTLFFVVSAFSLCLTMNRHLSTGSPLLSYGISRFFRIAPLFYVVMAVTFVVHILAFGVWTTPKAILLSGTFLFNLIPGAQEGFVWASWTIGVEMLFYVVFPFLFVWQTTLSRKITMLCVAVAISILFKGVTAGLVPEAVRGSFENFSIFRHMPSFIIGMLAYGVYESGKVAEARRDLAGALIALGLVVLISVASGRMPVIILDSTHFVALGYALVLVGASGTHFRPFNNAFTRFVGKISYSVYLWHAPVVWFMSPLYSRISSLPLPTSLRFGLCLLATLCVVLPLAWATYRFVEMPGIALGKRLFRRLSPIESAPAIPVRQAA